VGHLQANGFKLLTKNVDPQQLLAIMRSNAVPDELASCHTALVEGYVLEGHVPADIIASILSERPDILGVAVPGMPPGSPGMDASGAQPYDVLAFSEDGQSWIFDRR